MAAPTFVNEYETSWNVTTSPRTVSVTTAVGDVLVCVGITADAASTLATPTGGTSLTWTLRQSHTLAVHCAVYVWTATATTAETFTCSITRAGNTSNPWGFNVLRFSGSDGVGASAKSNGSSGGDPEVSVTTTQADSALIHATGDWNAVDGTSRTWRTINSITPSAGNGLEKSYFRDSSFYTLYVGLYNDVGAIGSKTSGLSAPAGQEDTNIVIEIKGSAGGGATTVSPTGIASAEAFGSPAISTTITVSPTGIASGEALGTPIVSATLTVSPSGIASAEAFGAPAVSTTLTVSPGSIASGEAFGAPVVSMPGSGLTISPTGISSGEAFGSPSISTSIVISPAGIGSDEAFGEVTVTLSGLTWRLVHPTNVEIHSLRGSLTFANTVELSVYGDDNELVTHVDGDPIPDVKYVWRGGYQNTTEDPAIKDLWLANGYQAEAI